MSYNAKSIQQLTFREGVRKRVGIYLGSADHTGVIAGLLELVNNATDEALVCPTATKIELEIGTDWASCRDYGRGMPHGANDFTNEAGRQSYLDSIAKSNYMNANLRDTELTTESHILTLSTCVQGHAKNRYLVQAVLRNEEALTE